MHSFLDPAAVRAERGGATVAGEAVAVMRPVRTPLLVALLATLLAGSGCFHYQPTTLEVRPGAMLRLQLTDSGSAQLMPVLGPHASSVDGRLLALSDSGYRVAVSRVVRDGSVVTWAGEEVVVPRAAIQATQQRALSGRRTLITAGVALVGVIVTGKLARNGGKGSPGDDGGGNPSP